MLSFCEHCQKLNRISSEKSGDPVCGHCKQTLPLDHGVQEVSDVGLQKIISNSDEFVLVDFWAEWCGPCRAFAPTFKAAAQEFRGKVTFLKSDTEANQQTASMFGIRSIPTLILFKSGKEVDRVSGALPIDALRQWLKSK